MKNILRKTAALGAAAVMAFSAFGVTSFANAGSEFEEMRGWFLNDSHGWYYVDNSAGKVKDKLMKIDGVLYKFNKNGYSDGRYTGWTKSSDGVKRRYSKGLPYTGWLKYKNGKMRYCLDGYMATCDMQIGDYMYSFDSDGFYTGKEKLTLITKCDKIISSDTEEITVALKNLDGREYYFGVLNCMERWENGKWVNCFEKWVGEQGEELAYPSIGIILNEKGAVKELDFDPQRYTNYNFAEGYYRIPIDTQIKKDKYITYAVFQVVSPVSVEPSEEVYISDGINDVKVDINVSIRSEKIAERFSGQSIKIYKKTDENEWQQASVECDENGNAVYEESISESISESIDGNKRITRSIRVDDGAGYYKAVAYIDSEEYESFFFIDELGASPWLEAYSLETDNLTVSFDIYNKFDKDIKLSPAVFDIYKEEIGGMSDPVEARISYTECEPNYVTLKSGESMTVSVDVSSCYDLSELKAGNYAVYIDGLGYESFVLERRDYSKEKYPFYGIDYKDIQKIKITKYQPNTVSELEVLPVSKVAGLLSQLKLGDKLPIDEDTEGSIPLKAEIVYKDGTEKSLMFTRSSAVIIDGTRYECNEQVYKALKKLFEDN